MNPFYFFQKKLSTSRSEVSLPLFPEDSENEYFYKELFNYYQSVKGKTIDTYNGESLFPIKIDNVHSMDGAHVQIIKA
ncbi:MAG: hypothetical protein ACXV9R_06205 [Methylobacter sp.]